MGTQRRGFWFALAAYGLWGLVPLYFPLLKPAGAGEILAHRMVWSLVIMLGVLLVLRRLRQIRDVLRQPRTLGLLTLAAAAVSINWGVYILAVNSGHVVEAALGYFFNPLVTIAFGVLVMRDRLRPAQWASVGVGVLAVLVITVGYGKPPWISLILAFSFGTYGLLKKKAAVDGVQSVAVETGVQFLPALAYVVWLGASGSGVFGRVEPGSYGVGHWALLAGAGVVTVAPLLFFGAATVRVPLSTIGMLQYLTPILQFVLGVAVFHESMPASRWAGFVLVWLALAMLTFDALRNARRTALRDREIAGTRRDHTAPSPTGTRSDDPTHDRLSSFNKQA